MKLHVIDTGLFKLDGGAMHGVVPKTMWSKLNPADENNLCTWAMRCLLVEHGNRLILIDTGIGNKQDAKFFSHYYLHGQGSLLGSIAAAGFSPEQVTDVLLTHLHFDHVGGALRQEGDKIVPTFPNATYHSHASHWAWATNPNAREKASFLKENILPLEQSGQLNLLGNTSEYGTSLFDIDIITVDGHTEKMMLPVLKAGGKPLIYCADLFPSAAHLPLAWVMGYDTRPLLTLEDKKRVLDWALANDAYLFFEHDAVNQVGVPELTERGYKTQATMPLADLG